MTTPSRKGTRQSRLLAGWLSLLLALPSSAFGLRPQEKSEASGLEELADALGLTVSASPPVQPSPAAGSTGLTAGLEEKETLDQLQERLQRPEVTSASGVRARVLTGKGRTYDAIVLDQFPTDMVPELKNGLSALLDRLNGEGPFTWVDGMGGVGVALWEGWKLYANLRPVLIDAVRWTKGQFAPEILQELEQQAASRGVDLWADKDLTFIQGDVLQVDLSSLGDPPIKVFTILNALGYNKDPLGILVNVYNQLPEGALLLTNLYIPTGHEKAEPLRRFYEQLFEGLKSRHGIADLKVVDLRQMSGEDLNAQLEKGPFSEFALGIVLKKGPGRLKLNASPHSEPFKIVTHREVEYQVAWYGDDPSKVLTYEPLAAGLEEDKGLSANEPGETGEPFSAFVGRQLTLEEVLVVLSRFKPDLVEIAREMAPGKDPILGGDILMPDERGQWGEKDTTHFRNKLKRIIPQSSWGQPSFDVVIQRQSWNRYGTPLDGLKAPYWIASVGLFLPGSGRTAAGLEEYQAAFDRLMQDGAFRRELEEKGWVALDGARLGAFDPPMVWGAIVRESANLGDGDHAVFADEELVNGRAEQVLAWVETGSGPEQVIRGAREMRARPGDLILIKAEPAVNTVVVTRLLKTVGLTRDRAVRTAIGTDEQVLALPLAAFQLLASSRDAGPQVVRLDVVVRLQDEAGNTYRLILMA